MIPRQYRAVIAKSAAIVATFILIASLGIPAYAGDLHQQDTSTAAGSGPENALVPNGERRTIAPNERHWYTFRYAEGADGDEEPSDAVAELTMATPDSISFEVWTEDDLRRWRDGEDFTPTGAGTPAYDPDASDSRDRSRLTWVGSGAATTTWYIVVRNESDSPASYVLNVTGPDVFFPEADMSTMSDATTDSAAQSSATQGNATQGNATQGDAMQDDSVMQESDTQESMTQESTIQDSAAQDGSEQSTSAEGMSDAQSTEMDGIGPASALTPTGMRHTLAPGETRWYTFRYAAGQDDDDPSEAIAEAAISRPNSIDFEVWTEDDVRKWANGEDFTPTGAGTPAFAIKDGSSDRDRRLLRWVGSGAATTDWYIILENNSDETASYRLTVTGPDVFFPNRNVARADDTTDAVQTTADSQMTDSQADGSQMADAGVMTGTMGLTIEGGTGPDDTLSPTGMQSTLAPNETRWYSFRYTGGADDEDPEDAIVELRMADPGSVSFEAWTEDDVRSWQAREDFNPTGAGTPAFTIEDDPNADNRDPTLLRWVTSGRATTTWYIVVENETDEPAPYRLTIRGPDVSF